VSETALVVEVREGSGKGAARKLRAGGRVPAILYGQGKASLSLQIDPRALEKVLKAGGANALLDLTVQGRGDLGTPVALVKELQRDPIRGAILHADLYQVDLSKTVEVEVPIHLVGKPKGLDFGGLLEHTLREVRIECLPRAIPERIDLDVSALEIGDVLHVRDLPLPTGVTLVSDPELGVAHVAVPQAEEAPAEAVAAEGAAVEGAAAEGAAAPAAATAEKAEKPEKSEKPGKRE
jgi:large subunit ribosomal protein L25